MPTQLHATLLINGYRGSTIGFTLKGFAEWIERNNVSGVYELAIVGPDTETPVNYDECSFGRN